MAYEEAWGNVYGSGTRGAPGINPRIQETWDENYNELEPYPDPFGADQFDRVRKPTKRKDINSRGKEFLDSFLIAQNPSFDIGAGHRGVSRNAKIHNLTRNNPNLKEVEAAKQILGGVRLPTF